MNEYDLMESIGEIDQKFINQAKNPVLLKKRRQSVRWGLSVAFACTLIAAGIIFVRPLFQPDAADQTENMTAAVSKENETAQSAAATDEKPLISSVYIPRIELPANDGMSEADMLPVIVYQGRIYVGGEWYDNEHAEKLSAEIGRHLGNGSGDLNEYSSEEAYSNEFASNFTYDIYSLNGYDTAFRIACKLEFEDVNQSPAVRITLLDCLNDITLQNGSDLFEDRLHLWEKTESIQYHLHSPQKYIDMDSGTAAEIGSEIWSEFADQVNHAEFFNINTTGESSLYESDQQAHLIVNLDDGSIVRLRLIEGGYVGYDALPGYFVKIPGEAFNAVYTSCGGTISQ